MNFRIGIGYDVHRLEEGLPFVLGGISLSHSRGPVGHSDGDVLIHAICDAMLGALALGDIGTHFPDTDQEFKDIDSKILLEKTVNMIRFQGYEISNMDSTVSGLATSQPIRIPHMNDLESEFTTTVLPGASTNWLST